MDKTKKMIYVGLLVGLEIILTRFLSIQTPIVRIGFGFLPIALTGIMFGPMTAGIAAVMADLLGMMLFPAGAFFPGFTLSAFLSGFTYGAILHKREINIKNLVIAATIIAVCIDLALNTIWLSMLLDKAVMVLLPPRIMKSLIMIPIRVITIKTVWHYLGVHINNSVLSTSN